MFSCKKRFALAFGYYNGERGGEGDIDGRKVLQEFQKKMLKMFSHNHQFFLTYFLVTVTKSLLFIVTHFVISSSVTRISTLCEAVLLRKNAILKVHT